MEVDELNDHLNLQLSKDDYETVGGFLLKHMERIPRANESFQFANLKFIITEADKCSIKKVSITIHDNNEKKRGKRNTIILQKKYNGREEILFCCNSSAKPPAMPGVMTYL